jgi:hypothetical protein
MPTMSDLATSDCPQENRTITEYEFFDSGFPDPYTTWF